MSSIYAEMNLSETEEIYIELLIQNQTAKIEFAYDRSSVIIAGVNRGSFEDTKAIFPTIWANAQQAVLNKTAKQNGVTYNSVLCSATADDSVSVASTLTFMGALPGQTNVPIKFKNGNILTILDDADLASFVAVWAPVYANNGQGYTYNEEF